MSNETYNSYLDAVGLALVLSGIRDKINAAAKGITNTKGKANGIASLDAGGNVPLSQLGNLDTTFFEVVTELPTDIRNIKKHIYILKGNKDGENNKYAEYIYTGDLTDAGDLAGDVDATKWEKLGDFVPTFDLQEYVKKNGAVAKLEFYDPSFVSWEDDDQPSTTAIRIEFADGSHKYIDVPQAVAPINTSRSNSELSDSEKSKPFQYPGRAGFMSASDKGKLDKIDLNALTASINAANTAADNTNKAIKAAETATTGAETCNVELSGSTISVTNRNGETKSVDVINTDEEVTVTISSSVESIKVAGIKINVFLNNGKTPQTYTTNAEGKVTFTIDRGNYYQVVLPEYGNAQPIAPVGYTAVLGSRNINVEYLPYDEDTSEKVIVNVQKCGNDNECAAWEGIPVTITFDGKDSVVNTDSNGQVVAFVPFGKEYAVKVEDKDGYNVSYNRNVRTFKAELPKRIVVYKLYKFRAGVFILDTNRNEYYLDEWIAAGRNADDAVAIKIADANLAINNSAFCIKTADMKNIAKIHSLSWCTQNVLFNSISSDGSNVNDENFYRGNTLSYLVRQEAHERSLLVPAFDYAYSTTLTLGGEELHGFIMSAGQELEHVGNIESIKEILTALFSADTAATYEAYVKETDRWTSSQSGANSAIYCSIGLNTSGIGKRSSNHIMPVYAC